MVLDITKVNITNSYDLINLSNILIYYYKDLEEYIKFLDNNFSLNENGEIINYFFRMKEDIEIKANNLLNENGYVEDIRDGKLLVYKK